MNEQEAQQLALKALQCGALSAKATRGVVVVSFQLNDESYRELAFAMIRIDANELTILEMRNSRTADTLKWERQLSRVLQGLETLRESFSESEAA